MSYQQQNNQYSNAVITSYTQAQNTTTSQTGTQNSSSMNQGASSQGTKAVIGVFSDRTLAEKAVNELRSQGFTTEEINIVSKGGSQRRGSGEMYDDDITDGALPGGTIGGIGGLLIGAGALAIPGIGPIVAAGPLAAALSGAVAGGIAGGLIDWGIPAESSRRYEQQVAQGNILAVIKTDAAKVQQAAQVLRSNGASDVESHIAR